jgi:gamma-glutamylcysteine synthetase
MVPCTLEQRVFLYDTYVKYGSAKQCRRKFRRKFRDERVPSRQTILNLVNKLSLTGPLIDKKQKHKRQVLTEKVDDIARLEHTPGKSLKRQTQETGVSTSIARRATKLLKLRHNKTRVINARLAATRSS